jgi:hypothetical protein
MFVNTVGFSQKNVIKRGLSGMSYGMYFFSDERLIAPKSPINFPLVIRVLVQTCSEMTRLNFEMAIV